MSAAIVLDKQSRIPLHRQVYEAWRSGIFRGRFPPKSKVPSTRELAESLSVSRSTITQAYEQLIAEGYLQSRRGSGVFVCDALPESLLHAPSSKQTLARQPTLTLSAYGARLQDDFQYARKKPGHISFSHWWPDRELFPTALWRRLLAKQLRRDDPELYNYATHAQGFEPLRAEIAHYISRVRAVSCTPEQVVVVNGSQQALDLVTRLFIEPDMEVAIENPGYLGARRIFAASGAKLRPVPVDEQGIVCAKLPKSARAVYVTPSHQFPTGVAMSLTRRLELLAWARAHRAVIIEDDYDSEFRFSGAPLPALQGLSADAPVIYCGTFSKVMFPGLRVGYVIVPLALAPVFRRAKWLADRNTPLLEQATLAEFMRDGHLDRHIRRMRRVYAARRTALIDALQRHFGARARVLGDAAGMHAFVRLDDSQLLERAARNQVQLRAAHDYYLGPAPSNEFIFGFASLSERAIREGVKRLAR